MSGFGFMWVSGFAGAAALGSFINDNPVMGFAMVALSLANGLLAAMSRGLR